MGQKKSFLNLYTLFSKQIEPCDREYCVQYRVAKSYKCNSGHLLINQIWDWPAKYLYMNDKHKWEWEFEKENR